MAGKDLVSIVLPNYNGANYLKQTIDSVLNQSFRNFELIIVDDGSTDNSIEIIKEYDDCRIKLIELHENNQICHALNVGIDYAKGEYIARIDSDDYWDKEKLEKQINFLENNLDYKICFTKINLVDDKNEIANDKYPIVFDIFDKQNMSRKEVFHKLYFTGNYFCHSSVLMRRELIDEIGKCNYLYSQAQDYDMWLRIISKYNVFILQERLVYYRWDDTNNHISQNGENSNTRFYNESFQIKYDILRNLSNESFCELFENESILDSIEVKLKKGLIMMKESNEDSSHKLLSLLLINDALKEKSGYELLKNKYQINIKELYEFNSNHIFNDAYIKEKISREVYLDLLGKYEEVTNSKGWILLEKYRRFVKRLRNTLYYKK